MKRILVLLITCLLVLSACSPKPTSSEVNSEQPQAVSSESSEEPASVPTTESEPTVEPVLTEETETEQAEVVGGIVEQFEISNPYQAFSEEEMIFILEIQINKLIFPTPCAGIILCQASIQSVIWFRTA